MTESNAIALIQHAITARAGVWADLGAGTGTFTMALAKLIGSDGTIHAVERDANTLRQLQQNARSTRNRDSIYANIIAVRADFTSYAELPMLNGVLMANALHFVPYPQHAPLLRALSNQLLPDGCIVLVEYDRTRGHQYNPYPISTAELPKLAAQAGLAAPTFHAQTPSAFGGDIYCASMAAAE